jgi:hypothetical protein
LTDDDDKLDELLRSVEAFYQPSGPISSKPTSLHYEAAHTLLDRLESGQLPPAERQTTLAEVSHRLELAAADEGVAVWPDEKTEIVAAYLALLHARLAIVRSRWRKAEIHLDKARSTFTTRQVDDGLQQTDALANALTMEKTMANTPDDASLFQRLLAALQGQRGHVPLITVCRFLERAQVIAAADQKDVTIQSLARTLEAMAQQSLAATAAAESNQEWAAETARQRRRQMTRQLPPTGTEGRAGMIDSQRERRTGVIDFQEERRLRQK